MYNDMQKFFANLWTVQGHHLNTCFFLLAQTLFAPANPLLRILNLNSSYIIIFKNPRDQSVFTRLASQAVPGKTASLRKAIELATERPYGYLVMDFHNARQQFLRFRSNIFPHEKPMIIYSLG